MERHDDNALIVYTDGSMFSKPRRQGGIGIRFVWADGNGEEQTDDYSPSGWVNADVPQMELQAVIEALKLLLRGKPVGPELYEKIMVYSDAIAAWMATQRPDRSGPATSGGRGTGRRCETRSAGRN